ncbi:MAG: hypothetical protein IRZ07_17120 [Microbispora sp.]|nr:hypothetical protein [Microbispora sp.]MDA8371053.1 hypothetical protein [Nocardiopsaceae bacterium]
MEADLQRWYQVDLRELWRPGGGLSWRRLGVLLRWLPAEAATWQVLGRAWMTRTEHFLAGLWELWAERPHPDRLGPAHDPSKKASVATASQWHDRLLAQRERIRRQREQREQQQRQEAAG